MNFGNDDEAMERSDGQWGFMKVRVEKVSES